MIFEVPAVGQPKHFPGMVSYFLIGFSVYLLTGSAIFATFYFVICAPSMTRRTLFSDSLSQLITSVSNKWASMMIFLYCCSTIIFCSSEVFAAFIANLSKFDSKHCPILLGSLCRLNVNDGDEYRAFASLQFTFLLSIVFIALRIKPYAWHRQDVNGSAVLRAVALVAIMSAPVFIFYNIGMPIDHSALRHVYFYTISGAIAYAALYIPTYLFYFVCIIAFGIILIEWLTPRKRHYHADSK